MTLRAIAIPIDITALELLNVEHLVIGIYDQIISNDSSLLSSMLDEIADDTATGQAYPKEYTDAMDAAESVRVDMCMYLSTTYGKELLSTYDVVGVTALGTDTIITVEECDGFR